MGFLEFQPPVHVVSNPKNNKNRRRTRQRRNRRRNGQRDSSSAMNFMTNHSIWLDKPPFPDESPTEEDRLDELDALSRDDEEFFYKTAPLTRQGKDGMIEVPLPFKEKDPVFSYNKSTARNRTINTLNS